MSGHVFVVRGDLGRLACDAWFLPGDGSGAVSPGWLSAPRVGDVVVGGRLRPPFLDPIARSRCFELLPRAGRLPAIWFGDTGGHPGTDVDWYLEPLVSFIRQAAPETARERPLLGIPFVGSGAGGQYHASGGLLDRILRAVREAADETGKDVVFVAHDEQTFAAAQALRRRQPHAFWAGLAPDLLRVVESLAARARDGQLVLFLGAGVSMGAGLPGWDGLLDALSKEAGIEIPEADLARLDALDRARLIEIHLEGGNRPGGLRSAIAALVSVEPSLHALGHALLACLPVREAATMNYDTLFEQAADGAGVPVDVLPWSPTAGDRWLLKLHGSVDHEEDIVLTRTDYVRYAERRGALRGLVQGLLITRHMVFVGFGLGDPNFHEIVDEVRQALGRPDDAPAFGTALTLNASPALADLWRGDLDVVSAGSPRDLEIALDHLLAHSTTLNRHLLDPRFAGMLTDEEQVLAAAVRSFASVVVSSGSSSTDAWPVVDRFLRSLGATDQSPP